MKQLMQDVDIQKSLSEHARMDRKPEAEGPLDDVTVSVVNKLFETMQQIFPAFRSAWPDQKVYEGAKRQWVKALMDAKLSDLNKINRGLARFRQLPKPFVPSPGEFIEWCTPTIEESGFPSAREAYHLSLKVNAMSSSFVCDNPALDTAVRHAIAQIGAFEYRKMSAAESYKAFAYNYVQAVKQVREGKLRVINRALTHQPETEKNVEVTEVGENALKSLREILKFGPKSARG